MSPAPGKRLGAHEIIALAGVLAIVTSCGRAAPVPSESHADHQTPVAAACRRRRQTQRCASTQPSRLIRRRRAWCGFRAVRSGWAATDCGMPDALPVHLVEVDGFWMDRAPVTNADFERFVDGDRLRHRRRAPAQRQGFSRRAERDARAGVGGVHTDVAPCAARQSSAVVALHAGRELEASGRPGQRRFAAARIIRSCTSRSKTRSRTRSGRANGCRPKPSSSSPRAAVSIGICIHGATS